jgi:hypothetical protein
MLGYMDSDSWLFFSFAMLFNTVLLQGLLQFHLLSGAAYRNPDSCL